jgi:uncharacterized protein (TIGR02996 family)
VTEDEAFIRAIVDGPGDDTPRLVYADWLDDRGGRRGAYLRAEMEWAKPWRDGERPADSPALRELARRLDPVWLSRVTRPPLGVCCEHVRFAGCGPRLTAADLDDAETRLAVRFPYRLRALLLNYNGGELESVGFLPGWFERSDRDNPNDLVAVGPFARIEAGAPLDLVAATRAGREMGMPIDWVLLALVPDASALVADVARGKGRGGVYYWDNAANEYDIDAISFQAASVADFLAQLTRRGEDA